MDNNEHDPLAFELAQLLAAEKGIIGFGADQLVDRCSNFLRQLKSEAALMRSIDDVRQK